MPIAVQCPTCGAGLTVPESLAGESVRCGGCQGVVPVPGRGGFFGRAGTTSPPRGISA